MDGKKYLQQILSLHDSFDLEALLKTENAPVEHALDAVKKMRLELEVLELLKPVLCAMSPGFTSFEPHILVRLKRFLPYVFETHSDPKTSAFRKLDCTSLKICGLCLTQKTIRDLKPDQLNTLLARAETASRHLLYSLAGNDEIDKVVRQCRVECDDYEQFLNDHKKTRKLGKGSVGLAVQYSLTGQPCWCFTGVSQKAIHTSFAVPAARAVRDITTFLPVDESFDCTIRMTVDFDVELLRTLFGHQVSQPIDAGMARQMKKRPKTYKPLEPFSLERAVRSQIGAVFGSIVSDGIIASHAWAQEMRDGLVIETSCVKVHVYPGSCLMITLRFAWREYLRIVQMLYK